MRFSGEKSLVFNLFLREGLISATGVRQTPSQWETLGLAAETAEATRIETAGQWEPSADTRRSPMQGAALVVAAKAHDMVEVHRVLEHPSEEITQKTVQAMEIATASR